MITSKQTNKHVSHVYQFIDCVHVFMCLILLDLIMFITIILMHNNKGFNVLFNLMELSLATSYIEPSNPTICMLLGSYKELEVAQNF
jgi:lipopolysaccharide/colanic/teichoic acid biosynthesis glycosyltransferase